jgi:adenylate cyclase
MHNFGAERRTTLFGHGRGTKEARQIYPHKAQGEGGKDDGDAFLVEFASALEAVRCAYDIQRAVHELNISLPAEQKVHLRISVHLGDVVESQGDILGDAVNVASRVEPIADDGGVCVTRQVYDYGKGLTRAQTV